ncbi:hypothetical protein JOD43_003355 [Pullulanibacillus pueri]|nr:hypothetical protein [Pullulanibacillus pueri]
MNVREEITFSLTAAIFKGEKWTYEFLLKGRKWRILND